MNKTVKKHKEQKNLDRKGFTLIELLAVIAVLSLVFSVVLYSITSLVKNARQKTYDTTINEIEKAAGNYAIENDDINFVAYPSDPNLEYRCVKVQDLIDYGFLDNKVTESLVDDGITVSVNSFVYLVRNPNNKTIVKKKYVTDDNNICINNQNVTASVVILSNPGVDAWARQKTITIKYDVGNSWNANDYTFSYFYSINDVIQKEDNNVKTKQVIFNINAPGDVDGRITGIKNGHDHKYITKFDSTGPAISSVDDTNTPIKYVSNSTDVRFKVTDCEDNNCSGVQDITESSKLNTLITAGKIKVGIDTNYNNSGNPKIEYLPASNIKLSYVSPGLYNLKITNEIYNGRVVINFEGGIFSDKVLDEVKNTNAPKEIMPNVIFDNIPLQIQVNSTNTSFANSQTATFTCSDNNNYIKYYFGDTKPTSSTVYTSINNVKDSEKYVVTRDIVISQSGKYYFSCKDIGGKVSTIELNYWNYTVKSFLNTVNGKEGEYTTANYEKKREGHYLGVDGMFLPFSLLLDENDEAKTFISTGSGIGNYRGYSTGEPSDLVIASPVYNDARLRSNITYCLWFDRNKVNISYNTNGGRLESNPDIFTLNDDGKILKNGDDVIQTIKYDGQLGDNGLVNWNNPDYINVTKTGYVTNFDQWICKSGCSSTNKTFKQGSQYKYYAIDFCDAKDDDCNVTLGVNWKEIEYFVEFHKNGGRSDVTVYDRGVSYYEAITIPNLTKILKFNPMANSVQLPDCSNPNIGKVQSYELTYAWFVNDIESYLVSPVMGLIEIDEETVDISAIWRSVDTKPFILPTITREGCTCGWSTKNGSSEVEFSSGAVYNKTINFNAGNNGILDITIFPVCTLIPKPKNYTVTYDCATNGGSSNSTVSYEETQTPTLSKNCTKSGWTFVGWNNNKNAHVAISSSSSLSKTTQTLYGIYKKNISVTYNDEGYGLANPENLNSYSDVSFSCNNNKCTSTCTLYNKDTTCRAITPEIVYQGKNFFSTKADDYSAWDNPPSGVAHAYEHSSFLISDNKTYYVPHDNVNAVRYNCDKYVDGDGNNRFRLKRLNISTCDGRDCSYTKINGLNEPDTVERIGLRQTLSGSGIEKCGAEYYLTKDAKCYPQTEAIGNPSTTIKASDCNKLSLYRTTTKIPKNGNGSDSWYYYPAKDCYISGVDLQSGTPSFCTPPAPTPSPSGLPSSGGRYYVYIDSAGGLCDNAQHCNHSYGNILFTYTDKLYISELGSWFDKSGGCSLSDVGGRTSYLDWHENGMQLTAHWDCTSGQQCYSCTRRNSYSGVTERFYKKAGSKPSYCSNSVDMSYCN